MTPRKPEDGKAEVSGRVTVQQAGRRGGCTTLERQGVQFYREIGRKGGRRTAELYAELLSKFGKKGGRPKRPTLNESMGGEDRP